MITPAQYYILFILRQGSLSMEEILARYRSLKTEAFGKSTPLIYHHVAILKEKELVLVEKSSTMPARSTVSISPKGRQAVSEFLDMFRMGESEEHISNPTDQTITAEMQEILAAEMLDKTFQTLTKTEMQRIQRTMKEICKLL